MDLEKERASALANEGKVSSDRASGNVGSRPPSAAHI